VEEPLKRRLIGATVLVSSAIIFVPLFFEDAKRLDAFEQTWIEIPQEPVVKFNSDLLNVKVEEPTPVLRTVSKTILVEDKKDKDKVIKEPVITAAKIEAPKQKVGISAWVIQVGSFSKETNAQKLVARLRQAHFDTMDPEQVDLRGRVLYRVRVGPVVQQKKAKKLLPGIEKVSGLKGRIVRYP